MTALTIRDVSSWDRIAPEHLAPKAYQSYRSRCAAIEAVASGIPIATASKRHGVSAKVLSATIKNALSTAPDGRLWGWRACIPNFVRNPVARSPEAFPANAGPGAFKKALFLLPELETRLVEYSGGLPGRNTPCPTFESFFRGVRKLIRDRVPSNFYPANDKECARRCVIEYIKKQRKGHPFVDEDFEVEDAVIASQLQEVFALQLGDWVQYDGHRLDAPLSVEGEDSDGNPYLQRITSTWLIAGYFALLRMSCSWTLSFAQNYSGTDFNATCSSSLRQWEPRDLLAPSMKYEPGSGIGSAPAIGFVATGVITSVDNAMAHKLHVNRQRMASELRGVIHFGASGVPQTRAHLEAWNKRREEAAIRRLPGAFRPQGEVTGKTRSNGSDPDDYPLQKDALEDLMDVVLSQANTEPLDAHQQRDPFQVLRRYVAAGGWLFSTRNHNDRASAMSMLSLSVKVCGNKKKRTQPYVNFKYARYRSIAMKDKWETLGVSYSAEIDIHDARVMYLYIEKGELFAELRAVRPWGRTRHSLALRKIIHMKSRKGDFLGTGVDDAIQAYKSYLRDRFRFSREAATSLVQLGDHIPDISTPDRQAQMSLDQQRSRTTPAKATLECEIPLSGKTVLGTRKLLP